VFFEFLFQIDDAFPYILYAMISTGERHKSQRIVLIPKLWAAIKGWVLRPVPFKTSVAIGFVIFTALLSALNVYLEIYDWTMMAFFLSFALAYILGTVIEQFKVKHWSLSYLAILLVSSCVLSFFLLQVSMLGSYPLAVIGWIVFALPFVINISYNLLRVSRGEQLRNL
jgi:hypothetical protein